MSDDALSPVSPEMLLKIGPVFVGALLSWMLFGISIVQLYIYHVSFTRDHRFIQASVYLIFLLDVFQSVVAANQGWQVLVSGWGRPDNLEFPGWTFTALPIVSTIISTWVQAFYAWRIHQLGKWVVLPGFIVLAGGAWALAISFASTRDIASLHETSMYARVVIWLGGGAFTDLIIMSSMLYLLYAVKRRTKPFQRSELIVNRLIRFTIETGSACALSAILQLALFIGVSSTNAHLILALILSKVYSNTLMSSLNARPNKLYSQTATSGNLTFRQSRTGAVDSNNGNAHPVAIHITHEVEIEGVTKSNGDKVAPGWDIELDDVSSGSHQAPVPGIRQ
ncbi:hypothetical protein C8Q74DRAFT_1370609 [Fomes fomentarius]|nr:hypothetical protein C8Q74DRAFT_1370609 [Fomes fomentarius]